MSRTIFKHVVPPPGVGQLSRHHEGVKIIHVGMQGNTPCYWVEFDPEAPACDFLVRIVGTGQEIPEGFQHGGTFFRNEFVWHVYWMTKETPGADTT